MTGKEILDLPMKQNDAEAKTIRDYLKAIVYEVWDRGEGFSGKRPFGNSGWERDLYEPLVTAGLVRKDENQSNQVYVYILDADVPKANGLICEAIDAL
jgi:hypothetical protein